MAMMIGKKKGEQLAEKFNRLVVEMNAMPKSLKAFLKQDKKLGENF